MKFFYDPILMHSMDFAQLLMCEIPDNLEPWCVAQLKPYIENKLVALIDKSDKSFDTICDLVEEYLYIPSYYHGESKGLANYIINHSAYNFVFDYEPDDKDHISENIEYMSDIEAKDLYDSTTIENIIQLLSEYI